MACRFYLPGGVSLREVSDRQAGESAWPDGPVRHAGWDGSLREGSARQGGSQHGLTSRSGTQGGMVHSVRVPPARRGSQHGLTSRSGTQGGMVHSVRVPPARRGGVSARPVQADVLRGLRPLLNNPGVRQPSLSLRHSLRPDGPSGLAVLARSGLSPTSCRLALASVLSSARRMPPQTAFCE